MGWKIDFDDPLNRYSRHVRQQILMLYETVVCNNHISLRGAKRETGIPRRTLTRYLLEYTQLLDNAMPPDYDGCGRSIDWGEAR